MIFVSSAELKKLKRLTEYRQHNLWLESPSWNRRWTDKALKHITLLRCDSWLSGASWYGCEILNIKVCVVSWDRGTALHAIGQGKDSYIWYLPLLIMGGGRYEYLGEPLFKIKFRPRNFRNGAHSAALRATSLAPVWGPSYASAKGQFVIIWPLVAIWNAYYTSMAVILLKLKDLSFLLNIADTLRFSCFPRGQSPRKILWRLTSKNESDNGGCFNCWLFNIYHMSSIPHIPSSFSEKFI
jgi:hypothetical protein